MKCSFLPFNSFDFCLFLFTSFYFACLFSFYFFFIFPLDLIDHPLLSTYLILSSCFTALFLLIAHFISLPFLPPTPPRRAGAGSCPRTASEDASGQSEHAGTGPRQVYRPPAGRGSARCVPANKIPAAAKARPICPEGPVRASAAGRGRAGRRPRVLSRRSPRGAQHP
jgi:hypothetical protein